MFASTVVRGIIKLFGCQQDKLFRQSPEEMATVTATCNRWGLCQVVNALNRYNLDNTNLEYNNVLCSMHIL